jgi:hypothetical protein
VPRRLSSSGDSGWPSAHHDDFCVFHRSDSTTMPSRQRS